MKNQKNLGEMMDTIDALEDVKTVLDRILRYKEKLSLLPEGELTGKQKLWLMSFEASEKNFSFETEEGKLRLIKDVAILDEGIEVNEQIAKKSNTHIRLFIKKFLIFIALLIISTTITSEFRGSYSDGFENLIIGIALSSLIVFVWGKVSRKHLA